MGAAASPTPASASASAPAPAPAGRAADPRDRDVHRADRVALRVLAAIAVVVGAGNLAFGILHTVAAATGSATLPLLASRPLSGGARATEISVDTADLSGGVHALHALDVGFGALTATAVALASALLLWSVGRALPFSRLLFRAALATGIILVFGSMISLAAGGFARMQAAFELSDTVPGIRAGFEVDPSGIGAGFVVLAAAVAIRIGTRLRRDTDGLV
ncbi:hypothetical protein GCM10027515_09960 [Schumannella luteola]|uniref:DUF2975 domain-containing protein n=1 Tax=Schumannella luteola TaxID=472059 RepID=A0A852Y811_9MICO|nr:hypothetical protein [Schumannella luteola]NYG97444.1 hypothetical protein [Schumannella luteola]TPX05866.1 hypothetical protein FJ656_03975 [Schumannella luteola]